MSESKRPMVSRWVVGILKEAGSPLTRKAIVQQLSIQGRDVTNTQLGTSLSNMRHRKQLVVTGKKLKRFSVSEAAVVQRMPEKEMGRASGEDVKANVEASVQEKLMSVYLVVKIAAMVLCTGAALVVAVALSVIVI